MNKTTLVKSVIFMGMTFLLIHCAKEPTPSLYGLKPSYEVKPDPTITAVEPASGAFAGIDMVTIKGTNFDPSEDYKHTRVYFEGKKAQIVSMTSTEINVMAPVLAGDSLTIKVQVDGAQLFGIFTPYKLEFAEIEYGGITGAYDAYGIACDNNENLYVSLAEGKVLKVTPDGEQIDYITQDQGVTGFFKTMKMGPGGVIYASRTRYLYQIAAGGDSLTRTKMKKAINDFDFDANLNIYYVTKFASYLVKPDMSESKVASYSHVIMSSCRVYDGYLYVAGLYNGADTSHVKKGIWRHKILDDGQLGEQELVFDWHKYYSWAGAGVPSILAITFAEDGDLYVGADSTDISDAITVIHPDAEGKYLPENAEPLYDVVLMPPATSFCWGSDQYLYVNRRSNSNDLKRIIRVTMGKRTAPYYGRQ